jgi:hypothetical protein
MATSYNPATNLSANPPVMLSASPIAAPYLGDAANVPLGLVAPAATAYSAAEGQSVEVVVTRSGASLDRALSLSYLTENGTAGAADFTPLTGTLAWAPGDPPQKTITLPLSADALAEGPESFTLHLSNLSGTATFPASDPEQTVTITIQDHPFDQWRHERFASKANLPIAEPAADYDRDGVANLLEYVFQTDPLAATAPAILPQAVIEADRFGLRVVGQPSPGVRLEIQQSTTLTSWQTVAHRTAGTATWTVENPGFVIHNGPSLGEIRILAPSNSAPLYLRLAAIRN